MHAPRVSHLAHWRRQVAGLYAAVLAAPASDAHQSCVAFRAARDRLFALHPASPLDAPARERFRGLAYFDWDQAACTSATLEEIAIGAPVDVDLAAGGRLSYRRTAVARFELGGVACALEVYAIEGYGGGLWLPFTDATAGRETYHGGRYLYDTASGADLGVEGSHLPLDFNFAYNPSCAYDASLRCPLSPAANTLSVAVRAGERAYPG